MAINVLTGYDAKSTNIEIDDIAITVTRRKTKSLRVAVHPPYGEVRVSVPSHVSNLLVQQFVLERIDWIRAQRDYFLTLAKPLAKQLQSGNTVRYFDDEILLIVREREGCRPHAALRTESPEKKQLVMTVPPNSSQREREDILAEWYRKELKKRVPEIIEMWQRVIGVNISNWGIRKMKTRWGSCNIDDRRIWLNLELAKKPVICLEYVVLHEMTHLLERLHNQRFWDLIEQFMPGWRVAEGYLK